MSLDDAFLCTHLHRLGVGTLSQQQSDGTQNDTLTCARLTCHHRETAAKLHIELVNQRIILNIKLP